ncbi:DNA alkylation repair protein [Aestuariimicrobium ganziense]|uniref:DNA alkylation repair protein n=1 Tax=Aestuariimicrobium ganziense TaxID=2773677 RepID=UPI001941DC5E|nr:DNA alkylation repair protein [Aestuariimicrobium ganziense]
MATTNAAETLAQSIRADLAASGNPERAGGQQRYMKSAMPYHGVTTPELKKILRPHLAGFRPGSRQEWQAAVLALWDDATHREERYAALALARHRSARQWHDVESLPLFRHLVVTGAWWDLVDETASHLVGAVLRDHRDEATPIMRAWATDPDLWVRRTAVLSQLTHKEQTDTGLLHQAIEANLDDQSFWLRKAIGWALRQYARVDPDWVRAEVDGSGDRLSGLSRREAIKHL